RIPRSRVARCCSCSRSMRMAAKPAEPSWRSIPWARAWAKLFTGAAARKRVFRFSPPRFPRKPLLWALWTPCSTAQRESFHERPEPSPMLIGQVVGDVVATQKDRSHEGRKILLVQPLNLDGSERGVPVLALDAVDAGVGD